MEEYTISTKAAKQHFERFKVAREINANQTGQQWRKYYKTLGNEVLLISS